MGKKILLCCNAYPPHFIGGAELIAHAQAKELQRRGFDVCIFAGDPGGSRLRHSIRKEFYEGIAVHRICLTHEDYDYRFVNFFNHHAEDYFKKLLRIFSPDIVHFHNIIGLSVGIIHIAKSRGIKTVLTLHDHWGFCFKNTLIKKDNEICQDFTRCSECMPVIPGEINLNLPIRMRQDYLAMQLEDVDAFISPSQYLADAYIRAGVPPEKMHVIWNGLEVNRFANIKKKTDPSGCIRFTFIGYFGKHKGIQILLDALNYLDLCQNFRINLVGSGELHDQYKTDILEKDLTEQVTFWGRIEKIDDAYAETDVFILPSIWPENQPVSITEAMAAGIPVIASNCGGIPELIEHGKTGLLFESGNARDLAIKMSKFIEEPTDIRLFGERAFEKIKTDTLENQTIKIIELYNKIPNTKAKISDDNMIIVCEGRHIDPICVDAMKLFSKLDSRKILFLMSDWLYDDQLKTGKLIWIVGDCEGKSAVDLGLKYNLPLLVPEMKQELKNLCVQFNCGLFYRDRLDAAYSIHYLLNNEQERTVMIKNGVRAQDSLQDKAIWK